MKFTLWSTGIWHSFQYPLWKCINKVTRYYDLKIYSCLFLSHPILHSVQILNQDKNCKIIFRAILERKIKWWCSSNSAWNGSYLSQWYKIKSSQIEKKVFAEKYLFYFLYPWISFMNLAKFIMKMNLNSPD